MYSRRFYIYLKKKSIYTNYVLLCKTKSPLKIEVIPFPSSRKLREKCETHDVLCSQISPSLPKQSKSPNIKVPFTSQICNNPCHYYSGTFVLNIVLPFILARDHNVQRYMAEKNQQSYASANGYTRSTDQESAMAAFQSEEELKRQKRRKLFMYIGIFIVFQIIVITVFGLTVMKVKTPALSSGWETSMSKTSTLPLKHHLHST